MTLKDLKKQIKLNNVDSTFKIFLCKENRWLANQYINSICESKSTTKTVINSLDETYNSTLSLVVDFSAYVNVLDVDEFDEKQPDYSKFENCIVICNKINKLIEQAVSDYIIVFDKLVDWQVKDYIKLRCKYLENDEIDWLYAVTSGDIYRIDNEIRKISLFNSNEQRAVLQALKFEPNSDLYSATIFNVVDAIIKRDKLFLIDFITHRKCCDVEPYGLVSLLLAKCKQILFVNYNSGLTAPQIEISDKQYMYIKTHLNSISINFLQKAINFLTSIDYKIKSGLLDTANDTLIDLIICSILAL